MNKNGFLYKQYYNLRYCNKYMYRWRNMKNDGQLKGIVIETTDYCNRKCNFCQPKGSLILTLNGWRPIEEIKVGEKIVGFDENIKEGNRRRKLNITKVEEIFKRKAKTIKIKTNKGKTELTPNHNLLIKYRGWKPAKDLVLKSNQEINYISKPMRIKETKKYKLGYLKGVIEGDGTIGFHLASFKKQYQMKLRMNDREPIDRTFNYLKSLHFNPTYGKKMIANHIQNRTQISRNKEVLNLKKIINYKKEVKMSYDYARGYLAGIFDAEGSSNYVIRIHNSDLIILNNIKNAMNILGFSFVVEKQKGKITKIIRLKGGLSEKVRFVSLVNPSITRKILNIYKNKDISGVSKVLEIRRGGEKEVFSLKTDTHTYISDGFYVHNCPKVYDKSEGRLMEWHLFEKIMNDLQNINYKGSINLSFYGEPLTDKRIFDFLKEVKKRFPDNKTSISTNADYLTLEAFERLHKIGLWKLIISQHDKRISDNITIIKRVIGSNNDVVNHKGMIVKFKHVNINSDFLIDRAKSVKVKTKFNMFYCNPNLMIIRANGTVNLCCNDYYNEVTFGNVKENTIDGIWNKPRYRATRKMIKEADFSLPICRRCREK